MPLPVAPHPIVQGSPLPDPVRDRLLPGSGFLAEEGTVKDEGKPYTWVVDPLDGTTNFIHGLPAFSISVALMHENTVILGTILDIPAGECYYAWDGSPAFMNGKEIRVSGSSSLADALLATGFPFRDFGRQQECKIPVASAVSAPPPSTWPGWPADVSTVSGNTASSPGTWPPAVSFYSRQAGNAPTLMAETIISMAERSYAETRRCFTRS